MWKEQADISEGELWRGLLQECMSNASETSGRGIAAVLGARRNEVDDILAGRCPDGPSTETRLKIELFLASDRPNSSARKNLLSSLSAPESDEHAELVRKTYLERLDTIAAKYSLVSDAQLAHFLGISRQALFKFRQGITPIPSIETRFQILNLLGMSTITDRAWSLIKNSRRERLRRLGLDLQAGHDQITRRMRLSDRAKQ